VSIQSEIQAVLDAHGDGWTLGPFLILMGLERIDGGEVESTAWMWAPANQPAWLIDGLLAAAERMRENAD